MSAVEEVKQDISELAKIEVISKAKAKKLIAYIDSHKDEIEEYRANGMKIHEITDLVRDLA